MWIRKGPVFKNVTEHTFNSVFKARGYVSAEPAQPETVTKILDEPAQTEPPEIAYDSEDVFTCQVCGKEYKTESGLEKHMAAKHKDGDTDA